MLTLYRHLTRDTRLSEYVRQHAKVELRSEGEKIVVTMNNPDDVLRQDTIHCAILADSAMMPDMRLYVLADQITVVSRKYAPKIVS